ncbi:uncharacterized protein (TIGR02246 family) [Povalibacter uvarum]|uniref:Uncharacterized protein (TIGR02246 family) n=1 Tax=Povalibacter uvarum TaxID=732238 RepID=A0A841HTK4_9GAMM|nr:nuclear transport factor 2 family protein [Povalibacter uvarum]MBB6095338.1 uncharacterized protein (TIGR02246 family) [Povalibacter uvarum]
MKTGMLATAAAVLAAMLMPQLSHADPLTAQDYAEIEQLYATYNHAIDFNDPTGWANTFTPDGNFLSFTGHEALAGFVKQWHERMGGTPRRHWNSNLRITGDSTKAEGSVYLMLVDSVTKTIFSTGVYKDTLVKTAQGWRFSKRTIARDAAAAPTAPAQQAPK